MTEIACIFPFGCHPTWVFLLGALATSAIFTVGFVGLALVTGEALAAARAAKRSSDFETYKRAVREVMREGPKTVAQPVAKQEG